MAKALVVVESPAKAKTINKYLGRNYKVIASMGHVRDLPKSKLGVDIEENFEPSYEVLATRKKVLKELKDAAKDATEIFVATDPDREGEAISWHIAEILKQEGYIAGFSVADAGEDKPGQVLTLTLKYGPNRERSIAGVRRVSKPGLRVYAKSTGLPKVLGGLGTAIISTSSGLLTDKQAAKRSVGGEVLAYVW